jgi:hypothetical protein
MKKYLFLIFFFLLSVAGKAQYNYQNGLLPINGITFKVRKSWSSVSVENNANFLNNTNIFQTTGSEICGDGEFDKVGKQSIAQVFRQVFPPARSVVFLPKHHIQLFIYADPSGKIKEVSFDFQMDSPVMPQELYQLDVALKALPPQQFHWNDNCTGVNYKITNMPIYIDKLH